MEEQLLSEINNDLTELSNDGLDEFEHRLSIGDVHLTVTGKRREDERWGEDKYATDVQLNASVEKYEFWEDAEDDVEEFCDELADVVEETVGFSGPIVLRSNESLNNRMWARRVIRRKS